MNSIRNPINLKLMVLTIILWVVFIYVLFVIAVPIKSFGGCQGSECIIFPISLFVLETLLVVVFLTHHDLAEKLKVLRFMAGLFLLVGLIDLGYAGVRNSFHKDSHYVVVTKRKDTNAVTRVREPPDSLPISIGYILSPIPFFLPEAIEFYHRKKRRFKAKE